MADGLLDFAESDTLTGYRLERLQVLNWGTFDKNVWTFGVSGKNSLLTGDIGSGKSTLVDAITTLLVPPGRINYNKAAGAEHKERDLRSYVQGYYKSERNQEGTLAKPVALRNKNSYTVILGVFKNRGYNQQITLAQVFWQRDPGSQPARFYVVADSDLTLEEHFTGFGPEIQQLKKQLKNLPGLELHDSFSQYSGAFRRRFGLTGEQALLLFHQTVSMKSVGNLTEFVREHMLEPFDIAPRIEALLNHYDDLNQAHQAILKAKDQIARLTPLCLTLDKVEEVNKNIHLLRFCRDGLVFLFARKRLALLEKRIADYETNTAKMELKKTGLEELRSSFQSQRDTLKQAISDNGGDRLERLKQERTGLDQEKIRRLKKCDEYNQLSRDIGLKGAAGPDAFIENNLQAQEKKKETQDGITTAQNQLTELSVEMHGLKNNHQELTLEIQSLKSRRSNIPTIQEDIRTRLCATLNITPRDLPFAGELLQIPQEHREWEGAIERVLHNFGLSLLVPPNHYQRVSDWVDSTNLRGRLVYLRTQENENKTGDKNYHLNGATDPSALLPMKVQLKQDHPLAGWLENQLWSRFAYLCASSMDDFRRSSLALTRSGQVKGTNRHEKDDRHSIHDRTRYILGWTNLEKIRTLEKQCRDLEQDIGELGQGIATQQNKINRDKEIYDIITQLEVYKDYQDLDWKPLAQRIDSLTQEIQDLQASSDILKTLQIKLKELEESIQTNNNQLEILSGQLSVQKENLVQARAMFRDDKEQEEQFTHSWIDLESTIAPHWDSVMAQQTLTVENADKRQRELREFLQNNLDNEDKKSKYHGEQAIKAMQDYRREYPSETREVDTAIEAGHEYRSMLTKLEADELPRFEERFKSMLHENAINEIANFQAQLNKQKQIIQERVARINMSLGSMEYNTGRYIRLEAIDSQDTEIRTFQQEMRSCTEGSLSGNTDNMYAEAKFLQVSGIIQRFKGREGTSDLDKRWTTKVTDVRNWFLFAASERWRENDEEFEHYTDSGGKSGGQKEKLAYTVLAASLAYQFGLEFGETRSRSFRFVVIDEAFGRGSDESTRFALRLFQQLNLQLLIVTPLQKIHIIEPYVSTVGFVYNPEGKESVLQTLTIQEYQTKKEAHNQTIEQKLV